MELYFTRNWASTVHCVDHNGRIITAAEHWPSASTFLATRCPIHALCVSLSLSPFPLYLSLFFSLWCNYPLCVCGPYVDYNSLSAASSTRSGKSEGNPRDRHGSRLWKRAEEGPEMTAGEKYFCRQTRRRYCSRSRSWNNRFNRIEGCGYKSGEFQLFRFPPSLWCKWQHHRSLPILQKFLLAMPVSLLDISRCSYFRFVYLSLLKCQRKRKDNYAI